MAPNNNIVIPSPPVAGEGPAFQRKTRESRSLASLGMTRGIFHVLAWLLLVPSTVLAQQIPVIRVTSELVLVDVVVRDGRGGFVPNLTAADFQIYDQGKAQKIASFELYRGGRPAAEAAPAGPPANWLVIVVDGVNTTFEANGLALEALKKWLGSSPPGTPVMVASLNRSQVRVLVPFTTDHAQALETLRKAPAAAQLQMGVEGVEAQTSRGEDFFRAAANFARVVEELAKETTVAMQRFLATLGGYPGRKNLVFLSAGYPLRPTQRLMSRIREAAGATGESGISQIVSAKTSQVPDVDVTEMLREMAATANAYGVSFYPVDSRGLVAIQAGTNIEIELDRVSEPQTTLLLLAYLTGGSPTINTNGLEIGMYRAAEELGTYYLLGFRPEADKKPRFHTLEVKLAKQEGYRIRSRRGYYSGLSVEQRTNTAVAAALAMPEAATAIGFASRITVSGQNVALDVAIPVDGVRFASIPSGVRCQLQLLGLVTKADGSRVGKDYQVNRSYNLELNPEQFKQVQAQQSVVTRNEFTLPSGQYQLTLVLRDIATGAIGARRERVEIK